MSLKDLKPIQYILLLASVALFAASMSQPAFRIGEGDWGDRGVFLVVFGGMAFLGGGFAEGLVWLANPLYLAAVFLMLFGKSWAIVCSISALILAFWFMTWQSILTSESGKTTEILGLSLGYYLWLAAIAVMVACTLTAMKLDPDTETA